MYYAPGDDVYYAAPKLPTAPAHGEAGPSANGGAGAPTRRGKGKAKKKDSPPAKRQKKADLLQPQCINCGTTETPKWRCSNTMCNACGLRKNKLDALGAGDAAALGADTQASRRAAAGSSAWSCARRRAHTPHGRRRCT